ncbi:CTP-phosphoethanolamine cytidylyltransferase [Scenedesmus sp. NREL 46B-D3]|nr:CTP-phosphoethanolamine cytidylyltransferase [Scenedesmus sp. NREL 46B-D3]
MAAEGQREKALAWAAAATGSALAAAGVYWAGKKALDYYVPYQYHYRPGTVSGWLAHQLDDYSQRRRSRRPVRVYMDGCFDMMHYGHANALRQAKALGDVLVVGLIPDSEILRCKGPPVLVERERYLLVDAVKWVDEVLQDVPYDLSPEFVEELFTKHKIDYIIHGDDPCLLPDGTDAYAHAKKLGRFKMIKRTEGVSTTDIVGRMLTCTRVNPHMNKAQDNVSGAAAAAATSSGNPSSIDEAVALASPSASRDMRVSRFLPTSRRLVQFSEGKFAPEGATIVYIDGAFDVFHVGHVEILELAKQQGDFLLVGLHTDEDVEARRGPHTPIMNVHERALSVLACKYVDEVIIGAPSVIEDDLLRTFNISLVVRGSMTETRATDCGADARYALARQRGIFRQLNSPSTVVTASIIQRIVGNRAAFEARNAKKVASEQAYYASSKDYVKEV